MRQVVVGLAIVCVVAVAATLREQTAGAESDAATARRRTCYSPSTNDIKGDIPPGKLRYYNTAEMPSDDEQKFAAFLKHALPRLQEHDIDVEPDFYITFNVHFGFNKGSIKQLAAAIICEKKFGSADNQCRNRSYFSSTYNEPADLADVIVDDILQFEPFVRNCRSPN